MATSVLAGELEDGMWKGKKFAPIPLRKMII